jgi:hypothetical protein
VTEAPEIILPAGEVAKLKVPSGKSTIPFMGRQILQGLVQDGERVSFKATDMATTQETQMMKIEGDYPDPAGVLTKPNGAPLISIAFDADLLARVCEVAKSLKIKNNKVTLDFYESESPAFFKSEGEKQTLSGVIMPLKLK